MEIVEFFAKLYGAYFVIIGLLLLIRKSAVQSLLNSAKSKEITQLISFIPLLLGLTTVILHNEWVMSWEVIITAVGWIALLKGVIMIGWPKRISQLVDKIKNGPLWFIFVVYIALGVYLLYMVDTFGFLF